MVFEQVRLDRPLSRLQLAVAVAIIALCMAWGAGRMAELEAAAEATAIDLTVRNIKSGVMGYVSNRLLNYDYAGIGELASSNPAGRVIEPPPGYIGALENALPENIAPGQWYYDADNHWLVYHPVNTDHVRWTGEGPVRIRIALSLNFSDVDANGEFDPAVDRATGVSVRVLDDLEWDF